MPKSSTSRKNATTPQVPSEVRDMSPALSNGDTSRSVSMGSEPSEQDIRLRAYQRYLERGQQPGMDFDDWIAAERDLTSERAPQTVSAQDAYKGAVEGDRPGDQQQSNRRGPGVDSKGMPSDPIATAQDATGARADGTQG